ncbi:LolA family protein [Kribbella deserti]|uniref:Outer membrane lipoprotein carrier protein LolA n=1 Tax=Kribbella deserti TaxID=1926257 RepID=A0ABV6QM42_9ACTN
MADASPDLPDITAQQLLTNVQRAKVDGLSGVVRSSTDLGLPALPGVGGSEALDLITGDHTARIALAAPDKARAAVLDDMAERVFTTDGKTAWAYDSRSREATKVTLPAGRPFEGRPDKAPGQAYDPTKVAKQFLDAVDPSTDVSVTGTESVAGRDAYLLKLTPRTDQTTVGSVLLAVDAKKWVPLQVKVLARAGGDPAVEVGFTEVSFDVPAVSTFSFTPPKGTKVTEEKLPALTGKRGPADKPVLPEGKHAPKWDGKGKPTVIGEGWSSVVVLKGDKANSGPLQQLLANAPAVQGSWGSGKVLTTRMVSALFTDDGRIIVGLVTPKALEAAAAKAPR